MNGVSAWQLTYFFLLHHQVISVFCTMDQPLVNQFPALPIFNKPEFAAEQEKALRHAEDLPLDTWADDQTVRHPPALMLGAVYPSLRQAWKATGWIRCDTFLGQGSFGKVYLGMMYEERHSELPYNRLHLCAIKEVDIHHRNSRGMFFQSLPNSPNLIDRSLNRSRSASH